MSEIKSIEKIVVVGAIVTGLVFFGFHKTAGLWGSDEGVEIKFAELEEVFSSGPITKIAATPPSVNIEGQTKLKDLETQRKRLEKQILDQKRLFKSELDSKLSTLNFERLKVTKLYEESTTQLTQFQEKSKEQVLRLMTSQEGLIKKVRSLELEKAKLLENRKGTLVKIKQSEKEYTSSLSSLVAKVEALLVQRRLLKAKNKGLSAQINQIKSKSKVFAESTKDLPQVAQNLFVALKDLEGRSPKIMASTYTQLESKLGAYSQTKIQFETGKSAISRQEIKKIEQVVAQGDKNAYFLIVGFADMVGNAENNKKLSSLRATEVAKQLISRSQGNQSVQAVYLGQTARFGLEDKNRIVEIWEIK